MSEVLRSDFPLVIAGLDPAIHRIESTRCFDGCAATLAALAARPRMTSWKATVLV
jgi:hypothetical protein